MGFGRRKKIKIQALRFKREMDEEPNQLMDVRIKIGQEAREEKTMTGSQTFYNHTRSMICGFDREASSEERTQHVAKEATNSTQKYSPKYHFSTPVILQRNES